ncbi:MAG: hypothetical protein KDC90_19130 [Ignavibacteriae bacterium]|nr:hypothetical protein [Ignavibacteriota bacterium]
MTSHKEVQFDVIKEEDYVPVNLQERERVRQLMLQELLALVERFDGSVAVNVLFEVTGNS